MQKNTLNPDFKKNLNQTYQLVNDIIHQPLAPTKKTLDSVNCMIHQSLAPIRETLDRTNDLIQLSVPKIEVPNPLVDIDIDSLMPKINTPILDSLSEILGETFRYQLKLINATLQNVLTSIDIEDLYQRSASDFFEQEFLEEVTASIELLRSEVSDPVVNAELEIICDKPTKKLTIANILLIFNAYLTIIGVVTGTKELYKLFTETDTSQIIEYNYTEQNTIKMDELNIHVNICPSLSSNQNNNELDRDGDSTNGKVSD